MTESIAGVVIPDSRSVNEATELVREVTSPLLFHHPRRVYLFGMPQGRRRGPEPNPELLHVGAMIHGLGLTGSLRASPDAFKDRPETTFGTVNADVLAHVVPGFERTDFVEVIERNAWPE